MHVAQLLDSFARGPYIEVIEARLPYVYGVDREQLLLRCPRRLRTDLSTLRANPCLIACIPFEGSPRSGSLIKR